MRPEDQGVREAVGGGADLDHHHAHRRGPSASPARPASEPPQAPGGEPPGAAAGGATDGAPKGEDDLDVAAGARLDGIDDEASDRDTDTDADTDVDDDDDDGDGDEEDGLAERAAPPRPRFVSRERGLDGPPARRRHLGRAAGGGLRAAIADGVADGPRAAPRAIEPAAAEARTPVAPVPGPGFVPAVRARAALCSAEPASAAATPVPPGVPPIGAVSHATHGGPGSVTDIGRRAEAPTERVALAMSAPGRARVGLARAPTVPARAVEPSLGGPVGGASEAIRESWQRLKGAIGGEVLMGNGAKIGLIGVLALIVLVVALWDKSSEDAVKASSLEPFTGGAPDPGQLTARAPERRAEPRFTLDTATLPPVSAAAIPAPAGAASGTAAGAPSGAAGTILPPAVIADRVPLAEPAPQPVARPAAPAAAPTSGRTHVVAPGETLASISTKHYGSSRHYLRIAEANRDKLPNPNLVPLGMTLAIPDLGASGEAAPASGGASGGRSASAAAPAAPIPAGARTHVVQRGETLYQIATRYLGSGSKHGKIYEANKDRIPNPNALPVGVTLVIPPQ